MEYCLPVLIVSFLISRLSQLVVQCFLVMNHHLSQCQPVWNQKKHDDQINPSKIVEQQVAEPLLKENKMLDHGTLGKLAASKIKHSDKTVAKISLSDLAETNQSDGEKMSEQVNANQNTESKLSDLPRADQSREIKMSDLAQTNQNAKLSELAKLNQSGGAKLSELSKINKSGGLSLSDLAKADQNIGTKKIGIGKDQALNKNGISVALSDLAKAHLAVSPNNKGSNTEMSPLSLMAKTHLGSSPISSMSSFTSPVSSKSSGSSSITTSPLSQLAKQDMQNMNTKTQAMKPGISLAQLAQAHGVKKSPPGSVSLMKDKQERIGQGTEKTGSLSFDLLKDKSDKDKIKLSLSSLAFNRPVRVIQQSATSIPSYSPKHSNSPTLMDLAKKPGQGMKSEELLSSGKNVNSSKLDNSVDTVNEVDLKNTSENKENVDTEGVSEIVLFIDDVSEESLHYLMNKPSVLGHSLCLISRKTCKSGTKKYQWKRFGYKYQMNGMLCQPFTEMNKIIPYDFSDPSPDDIVKTKQKQAFKRP